LGEGRILFGNVSKVLSMFSIKKKRIEVLSKDSYEKL
jgi:hypothetical protein